MVETEVVTEEIGIRVVARALAVIAKVAANAMAAMIGVTAAGEVTEIGMATTVRARPAGMASLVTRSSIARTIDALERRDGLDSEMLRLWP